MQAVLNGGGTISTFGCGIKHNKIYVIKKHCTYCLATALLVGLKDKTTGGQGFQLTANFDLSDEDGNCLETGFCWPHHAPDSYLDNPYFQLGVKTMLWAMDNGHYPDDNKEHYVKYHHQD